MKSGEVVTMEDMAMAAVMVVGTVVAMGLDMVEDTTMATEEAMGPDMVEDTDLDMVVGMVALDTVVDMVSLGMAEDMAVATVVAMEEDMVVAAGMVEVGAMEVDTEGVADTVVDGIKRQSYVCLSTSNKKRVMMIYGIKHGDGHTVDGILSCMKCDNKS